MYPNNSTNTTSHQICNAQDEDEGEYHVCVTKDDILDCVDVELQVLQVCDTEDNKEYVVSIYTVFTIYFTVYNLPIRSAPTRQARLFFCET